MTVAALMLKTLAHKNGTEGLAGDDCSLGRRLLRILKPRWGRRTAPGLVKGACEQYGPKRILATSDFSVFYSLGEHVRASGQIGTQVRYANRVSDGKVFVVKIRDKGRGADPSAFLNADVEASWRAKTELMLNLPESKHVAAVVGAWEDANSYYVVMENVKGSDLFDVVYSRTLGGQELRLIIRQLLLSLQSLHAKGIIHRDVKLENIVLQDDSSVKLVDFDDIESWPTQTREGTIWICGTDQYIAPEAYDGEHSPSSDLFAAGVVLYRMLTGGRCPFNVVLFDDKPGENYAGSPKMKLIRARLERAPIDWSSFSRSKLSEACRSEAVALSRQLMAVQQSARVGSAAEALRHPFFDIPDVSLEDAQIFATDAHDEKFCNVPAAWPLLTKQEAAEDDVDVLALAETGSFGEVLGVSDSKIPKNSISSVDTDAPELTGSWGLEACDSEIDMPVPPGWVPEEPGH